MPKTEVASCFKQETNQAWYLQSGDQNLQKLQTSLEGLSTTEAETRQKNCGKNVLPHKKAPGLLSVFLRQFASPLIYILMAAAVVSIVIGEYTDAGFIVAVILLNAFLGTYQEYKAEKSAEGLQQMLKIKAHVYRDGTEKEIDSEEIVPGDIVFLKSGARVPADARLLETNNLSIDESMLTGESNAIEKHSENLSEEDLPLGDRKNMAYAGSTVVSGRGTAVVVATALNTEVGKIAESVTERAVTKTPLVTRMEAFSRKIAVFFLAASVILGFIAWYQGHPLHEVFLMAVALAVAAIPEGLPIAMTVALSIGSRRMAKRNVIVRKLMAVEGLGSCTYIASDKTGTLTLNKQTVKQITVPDGSHFTLTGEGYNGEGEVLRLAEANAQSDQGRALDERESQVMHRVATATILCNDGKLYKEGEAWHEKGDPVDVALLSIGYKLGIDVPAVRDKAQLLPEIPYESERRFAARFYRQDNQVRVAAKGAVETLLPLCKRMLTLEGEKDLTTSDIEKLSEQMAEQGYRVLAIVDGVLSNEPDWDHLDKSALPPLTLLALTGMIDPLRPEVPQSIRTCQEAGIKVTMVTGDHPATALAIARQLGIAHNRDEVITGAEISKLGKPEDKNFQEKILNTSVFARVAPIQKLSIVEALKHQGHFIAVTGDGVNDTPALRAANIGIAMGSGSDIAKDTAMIIVTDDNFASIEAGVEEGRYAYDNVRKVIYLLITAGFGEVILVTIALLAALPLPLFAAQLLWLNIIANGIQDVALAFEAGEKGALKRPPRDPKEGIFDSLMLQENLLAGITFGLVSFFTWLWLLNNGYSENEARNLLLLLLILMANVHAFNARSELQSAFRVPLSNNWILVCGVIAAQGLHILAMYVPFMQNILGVAPITFQEWVSLFALALILLLVMELFKWYKRRQQSQQTEYAASRHAVGAT